MNSCNYHFFWTAIYTISGLNILYYFFQIICNQSPLTNFSILCEQIQLAYTRFGKLVNVYLYERKGKYHKLKGRVLKNLHNYQIVIKDDYKIKNFIEDKDVFWVKVKKINKERYKGEVYNFETDRTHTYTAENIILHNCHEIGHLFLSHHFRLKKQFKECQEVANISADLKVNEILIENGFEINRLGEGYCYPENDEFKFGKIKIKEISKKTAEEIYDEIMKQAKDKKMLKKVNVFDNHLFGGGENNGKGDREKEEKGRGLSQKEFERMWKKRIIEGYEHAKMKGKTPTGMERFVDNLLENKINWRQLLQKEIKNEIISDYSWNKRCKKSYSTNFYLPSVKKENLDVNVVVDLSGSISNEDLKDFLSEMVGMSKMFKNQINMKIITHEVKINSVYDVKRVNEEKILNLKLKGGGGTSHKDVWKYLNENNRGKNLAVVLTDGYSDIEESDKPRCNVLFVVSKNGTSNESFPFGKIVRLDNE